jgi:hypothetical protein
MKLFDWMKNKRHEGPTSNSDGSIAISPSHVSGIGMFFLVPSPTDQERTYMESQALQIYRGLNPEFAEALDSVHFRGGFVHAFVRSIDEAKGLSVQPSLNVVIQSFSMMLPGLSSKTYAFFAATWLTKPGDGKPSILVTTERLIPESSSTNV